MADLVENPRAFRLACISPAVARIDQRTLDGASWDWNEFRLTPLFFPWSDLLSWGAAGGGTRPTAFLCRRLVYDGGH